jgi:transposase InsO family protein
VSKARLVITAVVVEGRAPSEVARTYGVARSWVYALVARWRAEGDLAFEPRSRRPKRSPNATAADVLALIIELRAELAASGLDAGAETIRWHLEHRHGHVVSRPTVHRVLVRTGLVEPAPRKRPRSSYVRFEAELPNECWQSDMTHYRLADATDVEILSWLDDHSRYALRATAHPRVSGSIVVREFRDACAEHGTPASTLTDNGMIYTTRFSGGRGGRNGFESELHRLGIHQKNSRPNRPTTCGKVERFQQTLKRWLDQQPAPATVAELQTLLEQFVAVYNHQRPHRSLPHQATPATIYRARPKATPTGRDDTHTRVRHDRVRHDRVDVGGRISLRLHGQLHYIGIGRTLTGTRVIVLIHGLDVRVVHAATGELIRTLTIDPQRRYHGTGKPPGGPKGPRKNKPAKP